MHGLPVAAAVSEVLSLFKQRFHQRTANAGVAVSVDSVGEPRARHADLLAVLPLDHAVVSVAPFLHCQHRSLVSTDVLAEECCEAVGRLSVIPLLLIEAPARKGVLAVATALLSFGHGSNAALEQRNASVSVTRVQSPNRVTSCYNSNGYFQGRPAFARFERTAAYAPLCLDKPVAAQCVC